MDNLTQFQLYAADFEKTLADDDWSRLRQYFADDAQYEVKSQAFGCSLRGPDAIFKGIKKSLDGFDRKFDGRNVELPNAPEITADGFGVDWKLTYYKAGKTDYILRGHTDVRYRDGKITYLADSYDDATVAAEAAAWTKQNGIVLDPSYV
jgi:hypothetical protein